LEYKRGKSPLKNKATIEKKPCDLEKPKSFTRALENQNDDFKSFFTDHGGFSLTSVKHYLSFW
jgi:hypothetical protein